MAQCTCNSLYNIRTSLGEGGGDGDEREKWCVSPASNGNVLEAVNLSINSECLEYRFLRRRESVAPLFLVQSLPLSLVFSA